MSLCSHAAGSIWLAVCLLVLGVSHARQAADRIASYAMAVACMEQGDLLLSVSCLLQGSLCWLAMCRLHRVLSTKLGKPCGKAFLLITAIQFHLPFYMSRTLPNTFATAVMGFALADWVDARHPRRLLSLLVFATVRDPALMEFTYACLHTICIGIRSTPGTSMHRDQ